MPNQGVLSMFHPLPLDSVEGRRTCALLAFGEPKAKGQRLKGQGRISSCSPGKPALLVLNLKTCSVVGGPALFRTPGLSNSQKIPVLFIILVAFALHGPLLIMQRPANSYDANFHISMAAHYAHHWFNPWNESSLAGFSETTYPPLTHQWIALLSHVMGMLRAYLLFQLIIILLLPVAVYRYAKLWV